MCGIAGAILHNATQEQLIEVSERLIRRLIHRGPDSQSTWIDANIPLLLVHTRLAILDLSESGSQPMRSSCGRYIVVLNGEIYNHLDIRQELQKLRGNIRWRGHSDTETLVEAVATWGLENTLKQCVGMYAFAIWDRLEQKLYLVRDRMGEKPLYYGWQGKNFYFASELKAIEAIPDFVRELDTEALSLYFRFSYIPSPYSIYKSIRKLPQATYATIVPTSQDVSIHYYWTFPANVEPMSIGEEEACDRLDEILKQSVRQQLISDVPIGAFLSGGTDSSTIVAIMQSQLNHPAKTFTIGFWEHEYDEAPYARHVADFLGTEHTEVYVAPQDVIGLIPKLPEIYDEPFADSSQIPTAIICMHFRKKVTVALSGDGGDELFAGYNHYPGVVKNWERVRKYPLPIRQAVAAVLRLLSNPLLAHTVHNIYPRPIGTRLLRVSQTLVSTSPVDIYLNAITTWKHPPMVNPAELVYPKIVSQINTRLQHAGDLVRAMMESDALMYLPDDILVKVDRAAMSVALETRAPLLDHRVVEFASSLPTHYKLRNGVSKWLLKQVLYRYVPPSLVDRPKRGFSVPIGLWLRSELRGWAESLLDTHSLRELGFLNTEAISRAWRQHISGVYEWTPQLWTVLMFQAWRLR